MGLAHPAWPGATWIGELESDLCADAVVQLDGGEDYSRARLLVREAGRVRGFVEVDVVLGRIGAQPLTAAVAALPPARPAARRTDVAPPVTVTVSTRNRPDHLAVALPSLLAIEHPDLRLLVVDNASDDQSSERVVAGLGDPRVRYVREPRVGLSYGRNRALVEATTPIVAFTDDDVVVDPRWVTALVEAFEADADVAVVTGMVPTGELRTPAQQYFEQQTGWQSTVLPQTYRVGDHRPDIPGFPLSVGRYGTGANFAVRRDIAVRLGGFNEALGIGSPTHGGEDLDMFLRVLYAGWALSYAPDALVWHRHRADAADLERAVRGYSTSWTAWMTSLLENPDTRRPAVRNGVSHTVRRVRSLLPVGRTALASTSADVRPVQFGAGFENLPRAGRRALVAGPAAYVASRRAGRQTRPLLGVRTLR